MEDHARTGYDLWDTRRQQQSDHTQRIRHADQTQPPTPDISRFPTSLLTDLQAHDAFGRRPFTPSLPSSSTGDMPVSSSTSPAPAAVPQLAQPQTFRGSALSRVNLGARVLSNANAQAALTFRAQADALGDSIAKDSEHLATMMTRWQPLLRMPQPRATQDEAELRRLELEIPELSQRLARARQRWTECLTRARDCETHAARIQLE